MHAPADPDGSLMRQRVFVLALLEAWDQEALTARRLHQPRARSGRKLTGNDLARVLAVRGLARHVHESARAALTLVDSDQVNACIPIVRGAYEAALTAVWLVQSEGQHGVTAFAHEHSRQRRALQRDALAALSSVFREGASRVANADPSEFDGSADSARNFSTICDDLAPGGKDAYVIYRALSTYSHATIDVVDRYIGDPRPDGLPELLDVGRHSFAPEVLLHLVAASMVWSGRAFNYLTRDTGHRSLLRRIASELGIDPEPQLSASYRVRHRAARMRSNGG